MSFNDIIPNCAFYTKNKNTFYDPACAPFHFDGAQMEIVEIWRRIVLHNMFWWDWLVTFVRLLSSFHRIFHWPNIISARVIWLNIIEIYGKVHVIVNELHRQLMAAWHFNQLYPLLNDDRWSNIEITMSFVACSRSVCTYSNQLSNAIKCMTSSMNRFRLATNNTI